MAVSYDSYFDEWCHYPLSELEDSDIPTADQENLDVDEDSVSSLQKMSLRPGPLIQAQQ